MKHSDDGSENQMPSTNNFGTVITPQRDIQQRSDGSTVFTFPRTYDHHRDHTDMGGAIPNLNDPFVIC